MTHEEQTQSADSVPELTEFQRAVADLLINDAELHDVADETIVDPKSGKPFSVYETLGRCAHFALLPVPQVGPLIRGTLAEERLRTAASMTD